MTMYRCCSHCDFDCIGKYYGHTGQCSVVLCSEGRRESH